MTTPRSALPSLARLNQGLVARLRSGVATVDGEGHVLDANERFCELLGLSHVGAVGAHLPGLFGASRDDLASGLRQLVANHGDSLTLALATLGESKRRLGVSLVSGEPILVEVHDLSEVAASEDSHRFLRLLLRDPLTGLPNRLLAEEAIRKAQNRASRSGLRTGVLFVDLDGFKQVNDEYGHAAGDSVLVEFAARLRARVRPADTVARIGGDEFLVVCDELPDRETLRRLAADLSHAAHQPIAAGTALVHLGASVGARLARPEEAAEEILEAADAAMYAAKASGRGFEEMTTGGMSAVTDEQMRHGRPGLGVTDAMDEGRLEIWGQPIVAFGARPVGVEILSRFRSSSGAVRPPAPFLAVAAQEELVRLDRWVLREACERAAPRSTHELGFVSVNVSTATLQQPDFPQYVVDQLSRTGLAADRLLLELTEPAMAAISSGALRSLETLASLRIQVGVDDLGEVAGGFAALLHLPGLGWAKLDRSLVAAMSSGGRPALLAAGLIRAVQSAGIRVIAEGVETLAQAECLAAAGCDLQQGFHHGYARSDW